MGDAFAATFLLTVPLVAILALAMSHLDERFAAPRQIPRARRHFCGVDPWDEPFLSDPDGRLWRQTMQIEALAKPRSLRARTTDTWPA